MRVRGYGSSMTRSIFGFALLLAACSSSSSPATPARDAGSDSGGSADSAPGTMKEFGRVIDFGTKKALSGATIAANGQTATTGADGKWSLSFPIGTPVRPRISLDGYVVVHLPEEMSDADNDRADLPIPDLMTFQLAQFAQRGYDLTKASISVAVDKMPSCMSTGGATLKVISPPGASVEYFSAGFPTTTASAIVDGEVPAVTVYNLEPGVELVFELSHPTCKQVPYPVKVGSMTITGKVTTEAGNVNSVFVMYMQ